MAVNGCLIPLEGQAVIPVLDIMKTAPLVTTGAAMEEVMHLVTVAHQATVERQAGAGAEVIPPA